MIFQRRVPQTLLQKFRNFIWPTMGWRRTFRYYRHRLIRINDSSHSIAAGLAIGCCISFTPAFGTHLLQSVFLCWLIRGNWLAAWLGTAFGNPLTFPFLWWFSYQLGMAILTLFGMGDYFISLPRPISFDNMLDLPLKILLPTMLGGYITGIVTFPIFYYPFRGMVRTAKKARAIQIKRKAHRVAKEVTGQKE